MTAKSVLIIEDHRDTANLIGKLLAAYHWRFEYVGTLQDGIIRANSVPYPEVIVTDLHLPDSPLWETIPRIYEVMRNGPVVAQSADDRPEVKAAVEATGAMFCAKKFDVDYPKLLSATMVKAWESWHSLKASQKKKTSRIDSNLLGMDIVDFALRTRGQ